MKLYRLRNPNELDSFARYFGGLSDVKEAARALTVSRRKDYVVEEAELMTDKASIVALLNDEPQLEVKRTWDVTPRGALKEGDAVDG